MELTLSITELSTLTHKSRPSIYKYVKCFEEGSFNEIPYAFIGLFEKMEAGESKANLLRYIEEHFSSPHSESYLEVMKLLSEHEESIDWDKMKKLIEEEISHGKQ